MLLSIEVRTIPHTGRIPYIEYTEKLSDPLHIRKGSDYEKRQSETEKAAAPFLPLGLNFNQSSENCSL